MLPAISQICTLNAAFEDDIADFAAAKFEHVEVWLTKLEGYLKTNSLDDVRKLREENGVDFPVASMQGGLFAMDDEKRAVAWQLFHSRLDLCQQLEIGTIVVAADIGESLTQELLDGLVGRLTDIATAAGKRGLRVALEFQANSRFANNLQTAAALIHEVGSPHLGACIDVFHFFVGPSKLDDLVALGAERLFHVQFCDVADTARELAADGDRILPGDGDFALDSLVSGLRDIGYAGSVSIELMNPRIWQIPPLQVGEIGLTCLRKKLGMA